MSFQQLITKELLFSYFAGHATVLQKQLIEKWVEETPENEEFFYNCLHEWEQKHPQYEINTEAGIERFLTKIGSGEQERVQPEVTLQMSSGRRGSTWFRWFIAASVVFVLLAGSWLFRDAMFYKSYATTTNQVSTIWLEDGSKVVLNTGSVLQVPRFGFGQKNRQVHLKGEARFSVVHTPENQKFIVSTDADLQVEVLGTEFNLAAREATAKVVLQEGKVKVQYTEEQLKNVVMAPGDVVKVNKEQKRLQLTNVKYPDNYSAWQHGQYMFDQTTVAEIQELLHDNYGLQVKLQGNTLAERTVSGSIKADSANELLYSLSIILNISYIRQNNEVILIDKQSS